jgi:UDP-N-acetyl-D-glucosamine dehydrogenase
VSTADAAWTARDRVCYSARDGVPDPPGRLPSVPIPGASPMTLESRLQQRQAKLSVIGLGYVGLPLAIEFARAGFTVYGIDVDAAKVASLKRGHSYVGDVPSSDVLDAVEAGRFIPTTDFSVLKKADTVNICVPTPLNKTKDPDVSYIVAAADEVARYLKKGQLVILESTTYPGTTDELILPRLTARGMTVGKDFFLAFSPERVDPGNAVYQTRNIPKVVGGVTPRCTEVACALYRQTLETVVPVSSTRVAEMVKLLENTFRSVNIGLANETALLCDRLGIDVWEVIDAAATKPFGFMPFYPGPGLGGHCIPIDPFYLSWKAKLSGFEARFIELAGQVNGHMPEHVVRRVVEALNGRSRSVKGSKILVLGVSYKANIDDTRESPSLDLIELLEEMGAHVEYTDPHVARLDFAGRKRRSVALTPAALKRFDCVVIATNHDEFDWREILANARAIVDTRNALKGRKSPKITRL